MNQCDGCRIPLPINKEGIHYNPESKLPVMYCQKDRYVNKGVLLPENSDVEEKNSMGTPIAD